MRKSKIKCVVVHTEGVDRAALADRVSVYHAEVVERHLHESGLSNETQIAVINGIIDEMQKGMGKM